MDRRTRFLGVLHELADPIVLHLVVDRAILHAFLETVAHFGLDGLRCELLHELVVHALGDESTLDGDAHLPSVLHGAREYPLGRRLHVRALQHDGRVVAPQLERQALQRARGRGLDCLACARAARETDLRNVRVARNHGAECVVAAHEVDDPSGERVDKGLGEHQGAQRCVRGWLQHDRVPCHDGLAELPSRHERGEVPGGDAANNT
mmetsp:Transcript_85967/g.238130  ORF Transcript_85967/g.238130 Transcript_85967/m.238130 type:complete len:207 (+) Transcript_85967:462-1082(+)